MAAILQGINLSKNYGKTSMVRNVNLHIEENTIYGLLGRNGSGKTTILNMISGSSFPDSGEIHIGGHRLKRGELTKGVCYVRQNSPQFGRAKLMEIMEYASAFHKNWDWDFARHLLKTFKLDPNQKIRLLSSGTESIVSSIIGLASREPVTLFDEPVFGLDVLMRERFYQALMEDYAENPRTIIISSHLIDEIAKVVERVYIIDAGEVLLHDEMDNIRVQSHWIKGSTEAVNTFTNGKKVIYKENYGNGSVAAVYDTIGEADRNQARKLGIAIDGMPFQKFFSYLLKGGEDVE